MDDYERLRGNLNDALTSLEHLAVREDMIEINESLRCTAGGYGDVYRATLKESGTSATRLVAVKELRTVGDDVTRIRLAIHLARELRIWARLKHPNVLELIGYYLNPQMTTARFISPYLSNGNIEEYLEKSGSSVSDALRIKLLTDVLDGLVYLHSSSPPICHADIKPGNVLISDHLEAVLCDFGLARLMDGEPSGLTTTNTIKGSIRYMSPELLEEDPKQTLYSDIWAYGCLVLKVMTGSLPYSNSHSDQQVLLALALKQPPASLSNLQLRDGMLRTLLTRCWDRNPVERPTASLCRSYLPKPIPGGLQQQGVEQARTASQMRELASGADPLLVECASNQAVRRISDMSSGLREDLLVTPAPKSYLDQTERSFPEHSFPPTGLQAGLRQDPAYGVGYFSSTVPTVADILGTSSNASTPAQEWRPSTGAPLEKNFVCKTCGQRFARNHDLTRHFKVHNVSKMYRCTGCDRAFTRPEALQRHNVQKNCGITS